MPDLTTLATGGASVAGGAVLGAAGGLFAKAAHEKYADVLRSINWDMPDALNQAETILKLAASEGLPGLETRRGRVEGVLPTSLNEAKKVVSSPSDLLGILTKMNNDVSDSVTNLEITDAQTEIENKNRYASFLSGPKANTELLLQNLRNETEISAAGEDLAGVSELFAGIMQGAGLGATLGAGQIQSGAIKDSSKTLMDYLMQQ